jgi:hypothetical protein
MEGNGVAFWEGILVLDCFRFFFPASEKGSGELHVSMVCVLLVWSEGT